MVRKEGVEPSLREPQSLVLPLHYIGDINKAPELAQNVGLKPTTLNLEGLRSTN